MDSMKDKIDVLMGGENEANKLIDSIVPTLTSIESQVNQLPVIDITVPTLTFTESQVN